VTVAGVDGHPGLPTFTEEKRMSENEIIRSWKDEEFRNSLSPAQRSVLPGNPAGLIELTDEALDDLIAGAAAMDSCCWSSCSSSN